MNKKKRRIGTITLGVKYTVDLNDKEMVEHAKECFYDDLYEAIVKTSDREAFESMLVTKRDQKLKWKDVDQFLREDAEMREEED